MAPTDAYVLTSGTCKYVILRGKRNCSNKIKLSILRWGDYPGLLRLAQYNHKGSCTRKIWRSERGESDVTTESEIGMMLPWAKECQQPPEAGRGKEWILSWSLQKETVLPTPWFDLQL